MFTSMDKAIAAVLMGAGFVANRLWGWDIGLDESTYASIASVITGALVWAVPNNKGEET